MVTKYGKSEKYSTRCNNQFIQTRKHISLAKGNIQGISSLCKSLYFINIQKHSYRISKNQKSEITFNEISSSLYFQQLMFIWSVFIIVYLLVLRNATGEDIAECYETCFVLLSAYRLLEFFHANQKPANNNYFFRKFIKQKDTWNHISTKRQA